ncbi:MAG: DMT family transporter [Pseudomonadota bacterium]|nr:DMT family transporter [Pseudomonadota bacterium]
MPLAALAMVLVAACTHACWNLLAKRAAVCERFVWLYSFMAVVLWAPAVAGVLVALAHEGPLEGSFGPVEGGALVGTAVLHAAYSIGLQRAYRVGDLSLVYPIVRGVGPLLSFFGAVALLGEKPSIYAAMGAFAVVAGVFLLAGGPRVLRAGADRRGVSEALVAGVFVAAYTLWDGWAVKVLALSPIVIDYTGNAFRFALLTPDAWRERASLRAELSRWWREALGVAVLGPLGYILILSAMRLAPVSHVAPAREVSMLVGAWLGARMLKEGEGPRRIAASALLVAGVFALALGG